MSELRVPTVALFAEILYTDGRTFTGRIFIPTAAQAHGGPMRAEEWMNDGRAFFPLLPNHKETPILVNKRQVLVVTVEARADAPAFWEAENQGRHQRVIVECRDRTIEGELLIDMPANRSRVVDYLNRPEEFLTVRHGDRHHLVQKARITRVLEAQTE
jgi:hypothetical protein